MREIRDLGGMIDHTLLRQDATEQEIRAIAEEAVRLGTASVCVNSCWTEFVHGILEGTGVRTCVVVGFPLGACLPEVKAFEAAESVLRGAEEIDMVINVGYVRSGRMADVLRDIEGVVRAVAGRAKVKVILETCLLTKEEIVACCRIAETAGADFVKTSTGFSKGGATEEDVRLMRASVSPRVGVKAAGGIRDRAAAIRMIEAGADRIGASATVKILSQEE